MVPKFIEITVSSYEFRWAEVFFLLPVLILYKCLQRLQDMWKPSGSEYQSNFQNGNNLQSAGAMCCYGVMKTCALKNETQDTVDAQFT